MKPLRHIVFLLPSYPRSGGVASVSDTLAEWLLGQGLRVTYLMPSCQEGREPQGVERVELPRAEWNHPDNLQAARDFLSAHPADWMVDQGMESLLPATFPDIPSVGVLHGVPAWWTERKKHAPAGASRTARLKAMVYRWVPGLAARSARRELKRKMAAFRHVVALCPDYAKTLEELGGRPVRVIPNVLPTLSQAGLHAAAHPSTAYRSDITPATPPNALPEEERTLAKQVLYAGRFTRSDKRVDRLLRIWKRVEPRCPGWNLLLAGDGPERDRLEALSRRLGLRRVRFGGHLTPEEMYRNADILCLTSSFEGMPMCLLEASARGIVPVAFDCSRGVSQLIDHGRSGYLVPPFRERRFAETLIGLMADPKRLKAMSAAARQKAARYEVTRMAPLWMDLFQDRPDAVIPELEVLVATYGEDGLQRLAAHAHPAVPGVLYTISCQQPGGEIPEALCRPDMRILPSESRGLSLNRNLALSVARGRVCLLSDDDVDYTVEGLLTVMETFRERPDMELAAFRFDTLTPYAKTYPAEEFDLRRMPKGYSVSSIELAFRRESVQGRFRFDEAYGLGGRFLCGEEELFVHEVLKAGLTGCYIPRSIASHSQASTASRDQNTQAFLRAKGSVQRCLHPLTWPLRLFNQSRRQPRPLFFLRHTFSGALS